MQLAPSNNRMLLATGEIVELMLYEKKVCVVLYDFLDANNCDPLRGFSPSILCSTTFTLALRPKTTLFS
ncbi:hypothetical protein L484_019733 [Morus notabilis]|uniref:Uncharacterized protein n=1 Tax=Morus notabilis TaxID=981085 RepID=W9QYR4_9ROSA|nr:hypothetical protein L484_019733 [Morus notabilis]